MLSKQTYSETVTNSWESGQLSSFAITTTKVVKYTHHLQMFPASFSEAFVYVWVVQTFNMRPVRLTNVQMCKPLLFIKGSMLYRRSLKLTHIA